MQYDFLFDRACTGAHAENFLGGTHYETAISTAFWRH
jgi:hypothetical protein